MSPATRAMCIKALYDRQDALRDDIRTNSDYYVRGEWRGDMHRLSAARELRLIRSALADLNREAVLRAA